MKTSLAKRRIGIIALGALVLTVLVVAVWPGEREPEYQGKKLSEWASLQREQPQEATNAIQSIGTNALPVLIKWVGYQTPDWRAGAARTAGKLPAWLGARHIVTWVSNDKEGNARIGNTLFCLRVLGVRANPAIPELTRLLRKAPGKHPNYLAASALASLGREGMLALIETLRDRQPDPLGRSVILSGMRFVTYRGPEAGQVIPVLISSLQDTNQWVPVMAAQALGNFALEPEQSIPALTNAAQSTNFWLRRFAIRAIGQFEKEAVPVLNVVSNALNDSNADVRAEAEKALIKIAPKGLGK